MGQIGLVRAGSAMTDIVSKKRRSVIMSRIVSRNTRPEVRVRSVLHRMGFRFRLCRKDLPGKPDIVLPRWRAIIFVHGCFWHGHKNCKAAKLPTTNTSFWKKKIESNFDRDKKIAFALRGMGWSVITVWQCQISNQKKVVTAMTKLLTKLKSNR